MLQDLYFRKLACFSCSVKMSGDKDEETSLDQEARLAAIVLIQAEDDSSLSEEKGSGDGTEDTDFTGMA